MTHYTNKAADAAFLLPKRRLLQAAQHLAVTDEGSTARHHRLIWQSRPQRKRHSFFKCNLPDARLTICHNFVLAMKLPAAAPHMPALVCALL